MSAASTKVSTSTESWLSGAAARRSSSSTTTQLPFSYSQALTRPFLGAHHVVALVVFDGLDDVLPRHFLAGLGVDPLEADRRLVARIEHAEMQVHLAFAGHQRHRHVEQAEGEGSGPDRTGHGWSFA